MMIKQLHILFTLLVLIISNSTYTQYSTLLNFEGVTNGKNPFGSLFSDGNFLYGMTVTGGINDDGTIFRILPDGAGYEKLIDFAGTTNGSNPSSALISDNVFLYGTTQAGGTSNQGIIFKILPDGSGFEKLMDFDGSTSGGNPIGSLVFDGTFLYGMTYDGGINNLGTVFKIKPDGSNFIKLMDFDGVSNGGHPYGSLICDGNFLYGLTNVGGSNNLGTIFKIMIDGTGYLKLLDFTGTTNGSNPLGSLISDGTFLYGMTEKGGINNIGTIFKIMPDGSGYVKLVEYTDSINGSNPYGTLETDGTFLYGTTWKGGENNQGTIFKLMPDGTGLVKMLDFSGSTNASYPGESLIYEAPFLYGMTTTGGLNDLGVVYKIGMTTGFNIIDTGSKFSLNPNPTSGSINISTSLNGIQMVSITNILGEEVFKKEYILDEELPIMIDISDRKAGIYFLNIGNRTERIIKY